MRTNFRQLQQEEALCPDHLYLLFPPLQQYAGQGIEQHIYQMSNKRVRSKELMLNRKYCGYQRPVGLIVSLIKTIKKSMTENVLDSSESLLHKAVLLENDIIVKCILVRERVAVKQEREDKDDQGI